MGKQLDAFRKQFSIATHAFLWGWNCALTAWATNVPLFGLDLRNIVSHAQALGHVPTWTVAALTVSVNAIVGYRNWQKNAPKV